MVSEHSHLFDAHTITKLQKMPFFLIRNPWLGPEAFGAVVFHLLGVGRAAEHIHQDHVPKARVPGTATRFSPRWQKTKNNGKSILYMEVF